MKRVILALLLIIVGLQLMADNVTFRFASNSISNATLKAKMEKNISALLTAIQTAGNANDAPTPNLASIDMEPNAKQRLLKMWERLPFVCEDDMNVERCLNDFQGYQVRSINIVMKPKDDSYTQSEYRQLVISLNRNGRITGVRPAMEMQEDVKKIMDEGTDVDDIVRRREILKWVEDFRNYYNERNLEALQQIYSDDALIITGSVVNRRKTNDMETKIESEVKYRIQSKEEYLAKLTKTFDTNRNKLIKIDFDKISVVRHGAKPNIYGVTLFQSWKTSTYSDEGWLFLLWDFTDPDRPQIHVRTWQPEQVVAEHGVFTLNDFFIP